MPRYDPLMRKYTRINIVPIASCKATVAESHGLNCIVENTVPQAVVNFTWFGNILDSLESMLKHYEELEAKYEELKKRKNK